MRRIYYILFLIATFVLVSCVSLSKFKSGREAYDRKHYSTAIMLFKKELSKVNSDEQASKRMFLIAESYRKMDLPRRSVKWYKKSIINGAKIRVYLSLVKVLKKIEKYNDALDILLKAEKKFGRSVVLNREISIIKQSISWKEKQNKSIVIKSLDINSEFSDFASDFYLEDYLVVSSDRFNSSKNLYDWTGNYYYDLYITDKSGLTELKPFSGEINTKYNDASACFNKSGTEIFFVRCGDEKGTVRNCKIYHGVRVGDNWTQIKVMPFVREDVNYISPWLSEDESLLYFASDDPNGYGSYDLYYIVRDNEGWSRPRLLPKYINTVGNEKFVTTWKNELYFSSDYLAGLGGYDIFQTKFDSNGKLSPPSHLECPLNSGGDDFYLLKNSDTTGILSSSRINGKGLDDVYSFVIKPKLDTLVKDSLKIDKKDQTNRKRVYLAIKVVENIYSENGNPNTRVLGKKPVEGAVINISNGSLSAETPDNGIAINEVVFDSIYSLVIGKKGYLTTTAKVTVNSSSDYKDDVNTVNLTVVLGKIYFGKEVVLKNIYYDYDKWELRDKSIPTLDILYLILKNNPNYKIKIGSHTDCRGDDEYNLTLSKKRASSVVAYLIQKGVSRDRMEAVGYGKTKLIDRCNCEDCTEQQHQRNRRTTFEILK